MVLCFRQVRKNTMDAMLGFAGGVMIAASFWSLLSPAIEMAKSLSMNAWLVASTGFFSGGLLLFLGDRIFERRMKKRNLSLDSADLSSRKRSLMLVFSITLHNIPQGLAVGVAFGSLAYNLEVATPAAACLLALGIGLQNLPEGTAVSVPLRREGYSRRRSFVIGWLSGMVEPISSVLGAILVTRICMLLPSLLAFAAGAMVYVVVEELIPESQTNGYKDFMALATLAGFSVMMVLDVALG